MAYADDRSNEVYVDERRLRRMLAEYPTKSNKPFVDQFVREFKGQPGGERIREGVQGARAIPWHEFRRRVGAEEVSPQETLEGWGLNAASTDEDFRRAVKKRYPDYPDHLLEPGAFGRVSRRSFEKLAAVTEGTEAERVDWSSFFRCLLQSWPLWVVMALQAALIGAFFSGGNIVAALIGAAVGLGIGIVISVMACLAVNWV